MKVCLHLLLIAGGVLLPSILFAQKLKHGDYIEKIDGLNIHYTVKGIGPVMLVGHSNSGKVGYELTLKPLEKKFTMVYYEPRGTGKSDAPKTLDEYKFQYLVSEIEGFRKKLGIEKIWIFGHSDQSAVALQYTIDYPDNVEGLILCGTSLIGTKAEMVERRKKAEADRMKQSEWFRQVIKDWDYMNEHNTNRDKEGRALSMAPLKWWCYNEETFQKNLPVLKAVNIAGRRKPINGKYYFDTDEERERYLNYQQKFRTIETNILIVNGKFDTNNPPKYVEQLHNELPQSSLFIIDKAGHFPWVEQPEETFKVINKWLSKEKNSS